LAKPRREGNEVSARGGANGRPTREDVLKTPVEMIDLSRVDTVADLVDQFKTASIQARAFGKCASVYENMLTDEARPTVIIGLTGALIAAGLRKVLRDMVQEGIIDVVVSTGAILYQDFYQSQGFKHFVGDVNADNVALHELWIDRIYDTYVDEEAFRKCDRQIAQLAEKFPQETMSSRVFMDHLGKVASKDPQSFIGECHRRGVPIFCPAIADSSIGIGLVEYYQKNRTKKDRLIVDPIRDNYEITQIKGLSPKVGAIYIGGGVPKNYINDAEVMAEELGYDTEGHEYALQITADAPHWGGLSGSTLEEAQSWGKIHREATKATVYMEASLGLPLLVAHVLQKGLHKGRARVEFVWDGDTLVELRSGKKAAKKPPAKPPAKAATLRASR
jgi:deoxyhypusine synthase